MTLIGARSLRSAFAATAVVWFAASMVGCASARPLTPVEVSDVKSVAGTWRGIVYRSRFEPDKVEVTIREDGSYDLVSLHPNGTSRGKGQIVVSSDGRLIIQGERGRGVGTLLSKSGGDRVLSIQATLADNSVLTADLYPHR